MVAKNDEFESCHPDFFILQGLKLSSQEVLETKETFLLLRDWSEVHLNAYGFLFTILVRRHHGDESG